MVECPPMEPPGAAVRRAGRAILRLLPVLILLGAPGCGIETPDSDLDPANGGVPAEHAVVRSVEKIVQIERLVSVAGEHPLNGSASHHWAQMAADGTIGMVYRENPDDRADAEFGRLIFKTISPEGRLRDEEVARGGGVENCVFLYDSAGAAHIFATLQDGAAQDLIHFSSDAGTSWKRETVARFENSGGEYVAELAAGLGPADSLHLAALQFSATPDHFMTANYGSRMYYFADSGGFWKREFIEHFDSLDILRNPDPDRWYMRAIRRFDLIVDAGGRAHLVYGAIVHQSGRHPTEMRYATNAGGAWAITTAIPVPDIYSDAGYNPSVALDSAGRLALASTFVPRVSTGSATKSQLVYAVYENRHWRRTILAEAADGYIGGDGGEFTGAIPHLLFDAQDLPRILFSDIASTHFEYGSFLTTGQIRHIRFNGRDWEVSTLYRQPGPRDYDHIDEIHGQCLIEPAPGTTTWHVLAEEYLLSGSAGTHNLIHLRFE